MAYTYEEILNKYINRLGRDITAGEVVYDLRHLAGVTDVSLVKCAKCKFHEDDIYCGLLMIPTNGDWFCADGERREDG